MGLILSMMWDGLGAGVAVVGLDATSKTGGAAELDGLVPGGGYAGTFELGGCMGLTLFMMWDGLGAGAVVGLGPGPGLDATGKTGGAAELDGLMPDGGYAGWFELGGCMGLILFMMLDGLGLAVGLALGAPLKSWHATEPRSRSRDRTASLGAMAIAVSIDRIADIVITSYTKFLCVFSVLRIKRFIARSSLQELLTTNVAARSGAACEFKQWAHGAHTQRIRAVDLCEMFTYLSCRCVLG
jgi:hypothetical protein